MKYLRATKHLEPSLYSHQRTPPLKILLWLLSHTGNQQIVQSIKNHNESFVSRLTPSARRHKNMSFAILAEPTSAPGSRSPSPTGRVSPFRGRGFNPVGSRHASPIPSPPPQEAYVISDSPGKSKIPRLSRRGSAAAFGERVVDFQASPNRRKLNAQLSQSLTNIAPPKVAGRPPPSPRRQQAYNRTFQRLSPIVGSSPEPSQSQSSPKLYTSSQQQSKFSSPGRSRSFVNRPPRNSSRPASKAASRNASREPSPGKNPTSPTRIPMKSYKNVQAKVNSFSRPKPKVPPKPQVLSEETEDSDAVVARRKTERRESVKRTNPKTNVNSYRNNNNSKAGNKNVAKDSNDNPVTSKNNNNNVNSKNNTINKSVEGNLDKAGKSRDVKDANGKQAGNKGSNNNNNNNGGSSNISNNNTAEASTKNETKDQAEPLKKSESAVKLSELLQPSTTTVVSSTTSTVTQPLKIEAKIDPAETKTDPSKPTPRSESKPMAPMVDGRVLSATSVSNAMNKMNDTVINTQTLIKESGLTKLSPAASAIISMSNEAKHTNPALDTKNATTALPTVEENVAVPAVKPNGQNSNHVTSTGIVPSARVLEQHVQNNMSKLSPEHKIGNSVQKSVNDRIIEARTVVAHDVKPIRITVKEKPMDVEVQSGNIRFDTSNGLNERPG
jgi:hypothetical protein